MQETQDTEVTLGTGRLLALFFGLVVICALFFSLGFSLGRKSVPSAAAATVTAPPIVAATEARPAGEKAAKTDSPADASSGSNELSFYKAVEQKDAPTQLEAPAESNAPDNKAPELSRPSSAGSGYMVQVAAVTKQEDAQALVDALRKKQYPVFTSAVPTDKLFHVQVGPFPELKDAEAMKAKLVSDGYNPIVKR